MAAVPRHMRMTQEEQSRRHSLAGVLPSARMTQTIVLGIALFFLQAEDGILAESVTGVQTCALPIYLFFQAEDGIRDESVTGVQTCALPIYSSHTLISYAVFCLRDESVTG